MTAANSPLALYREAVERQGFAPYEAQRVAAARLDACRRALSRLQEMQLARFVGLPAGE
ncbi:hypothetical protein [Halomonas sp. DQ26W]|uniref:hypothetical protein n=1 Tax=Halomonas sp. DQ26W TaxID=2282311 RepID=UPI0015F003A1|nr:hypothetical protein [Halomonas sp. DQ26W]